MKRWLKFICVVAIISLFLIGCSAQRKIEFKEIYSETIGFSDSVDKYKPISQDAVLLLTNEDFQIFMDKYFTKRKIPIESMDKEKAVLYLQIPSTTNAVDTYYVENMYVKNSTLTVNLTKMSAGYVDAKEGFNGIFKWVLVLEVDKHNLKDDMKIVIEK